MKVGDLVKVIHPGGNIAVPFVGEVGVIIHKRLALCEDQDSFSVMTNNKIFVLGSNYLEVIDETS